jgi:uncharacterized repeat protein (TIGR01451 family)
MKKMNNKIMKYTGAVLVPMIIGAIFAFALPVFAATIDNSGGASAGNIVIMNSTVNGGTYNWSNSVSANPGDVVEVAIYYHNAGPDTAQNVILHLNQPGSGTMSSFTFNGSITSNNASTVSGSPSVNFASAQTLTPNGSAWLVQNGTGSGSSVTGSSVFGSGYVIGDVPAGGYGTFTVQFTVGSGQQTQNPTVTTSSPTNVTTSSATFNGTVNTNTSSNVATYFEYSSYTCPTAWQPGIQIGSQTFNSNGTYSMNATASNLQPNTTYYVSAVASVNGVKYYGTNGCQTFYTNGNGSQIMTVTTNAVSNVNWSSATFNGYVSTNGSGNQTVTTFFQYGTTYPPTWQAGTQTIYGSGNFSTNQTGLGQNTTYYVRAGAYGSDGNIVYAPNYVTFSTYNNNNNNNYYNTYPTVTTYSATNVVSNSATLNGYVTSNGDTNMYAYFEWGTDYNLGNRTSSQYVGNATTYLSASLNGQLQNNTTYYFRAAAQGQNGVITRGQTMSFSTSQGYQYPQNNITVNTQPATEVFTDSARMNCSVNWNSGLGYGTYTNVWFEYGTTMNLGNQTLVQTLTNSGSCSRVALYLSPSTNYYFRAVGQVPGGSIVRGNILGFTTGYGTSYTPVTTTPTPSTSGRATLNEEVANLSFPNGTKTAIAAFAGNTIEYAITVSNTGTADLSNVVLRNKLSSYTTFVSASDAGTFSASTGDVTWNLSSLGAGQTKKVTVRVTANSANDNVVAEDTARLSTDSISRTSNTTIAIIQVTPLMLSLVPDRDRVVPGDTVNYTVNYKNDGKSSLAGASLQVVLPVGMDFQSSDKNFVREENNSYRADIGSIDAEGQGSVTLRAVVGKDVPNGKVLTANAVMSYNDAFLKKQIDVNTYSNVVADSNARMGAAVSNANAPVNASLAAGIGTATKSGFFPQSLLGWIGLILLIAVLVILIRKNI